MKKNKYSNQNSVEKTIKKIHKDNKEKVPEYLDKLKEEKQTVIKEASYNNEYLKYML